MFVKVDRKYVTFFKIRATPFKDSQSHLILHAIFKIPEEWTKEKGMEWSGWDNCQDKETFKFLRTRGHVKGIFPATRIHTERDTHVHRETHSAAQRIVYTCMWLAEV